MKLHNIPCVSFLMLSPWSCVCGSLINGLHFKYDRCGHRRMCVCVCVRDSLRIHRNFVNECWIGTFQPFPSSVLWYFHLAYFASYISASQFKLRSLTNQDTTAWFHHYTYTFRLCSYVLFSFLFTFSLHFVSNAYFPFSIFLFCSFLIIHKWLNDVI